VGADFGFSSYCGLGCRLCCILPFGCCCICWRISGPSFLVVSACCQASNPPRFILPVMSLYCSLASCPGSTPFITFEIMFVQAAPHSVWFSCWICHFCGLSSIHVIICHPYASMWDVGVSLRFTLYPTVRCSCLSSSAWYRIVLTVQLLQSLGVMVVNMASVLILLVLF